MPEKKVITMKKSKLNKEMRTDEEFVQSIIEAHKCKIEKLTKEIEDIKIIVDCLELGTEMDIILDERRKLIRPIMKYLNKEDKDEKITKLKNNLQQFDRHFKIDMSQLEDIQFKY
jgi:hypothetical protein